MSIPDLGAPAQPQPQPQPSDSQPPRNWQQWQGRNQFYCDGRVMGGPAEGVRTLWVTIVLVIVPSVVFAALPARDFDRLGYWVLPVGLGLFALTLFFLCATGFSDPGVVPRSTDKSREIDSLNFRKPPRQQDVLGAGQVYALKYCDTCSIIRPPRSIHCSICNNCVEVFDHHCPWVGNCVGKRNYRQFIGFIYSTTCYSVFMIAICITRLKKMTDEKDGDFVETLKTDPSPLILIVYCIPAFGFVIAMSVFHTYLICRGETTNESLKRLFPFGSPFSRGVCGNFQRAVCSVPSESHVKPRAVVSTLASATAAHGGRPTRTPSYSVAAYGGASAGGPGYGAPSEPYHQGGSIAMAALGPNGNGNGNGGDDDDTVVPAPLQPVVAVMNERRVVFLDHQQMDAHARAKNADRFVAAATPVAASAPAASNSAAVSANAAPAVAVAISSPSAAPAAAQAPAPTETDDDLSYRPTRFAAEDAAAAAAANAASVSSPAAVAAAGGAPQPLLHRRSTVELPVTPTAEVLALQAPAALPAMTTLAPPSSSVAFGPAAPTGAAVALPPLGYSAPLPSAPPSLPPMQPLR